MRELPYLRLAVAMLVLTVVISVIMLIPDWNGEQASTAADDIDRLFEISIVFSSFVFSVVMVLLGYSIWKWRARPGDESDGEPIHGNTRLEIAWTAIPTVIVIFLAALSWIVLDDIEAKESDGDTMTIEVTGQQFTWSFAYPDEGIVSEELHVLVDQQIEVELRALDVIHSFWVPEWRIKRDAVPGAPGADIDADFVVTPDKPGNYSLICTELCGLGHSTMRTPVVVHDSEQEFRKWISEQDPIPAEEEPAGEGPAPPSGGQPQEVESS